MEVRKTDPVDGVGSETTGLSEDVWGTPGGFGLSSSPSGSGVTVD